MRTRPMLSSTMAGLALLLLYGCAGTEVTTIRSYGNGDEKQVVDAAFQQEAERAADKAADGIRYYEQVPYLLVYTDGKGGLKSQMLYLPDTTRKKVMRPYARLASNKLVLTLDHGVLTESVETVDETVLPKAAIDAVATSLIAAADMGKTGGDKDAIPPPALYRIWVKPDGTIELIGGYGKGPDGTARENLHITVSQPPEKEAAKAK